MVGKRKMAGTTLVSIWSMALIGLQEWRNGVYIYKIITILFLNNKLAVACFFPLLMWSVA